MFKGACKQTHSPSCAEHGDSFPVTRLGAPDVLLTSSSAVTHGEDEGAAGTRLMLAETRESLQRAAVVHADP